MNNPNATDNLSPFPPGQSGNPSGRPRGPITQFLREYGEAIELKFTIEKTDPEGKTTKSTARLSTQHQTINQAIAARLLQMALAGDIKAIKEVLNRTEGRVPQPLNIGGQNGNPVQVVAYIPSNNRRTMPLDSLPAEDVTATDAGTDH